MKKTKTTKPPSDEYQRFEKLARALIAVPKSEIDKRQAEYEKKEGREEKESRVNRRIPNPSFTGENRRTLMARLDLILDLSAIVLGVLGTVFLVREVSKAHEFEKLSRDMATVKEMMALFKSDIKEFYVVSAMETFNKSRESMETLADSLGEDAIRKTAEEDPVLKSAPESIARWEHYTSPAQLLRRKRLLWTGFVFLMGAAAIQVIAALAKHGR